jgi:hypothetical protein
MMTAFDDDVDERQEDDDAQAAMLAELEALVELGLLSPTPARIA